MELGISVQSYNGDLLHEPWDIYDESGHAFTTFDPFWSRCLQMQMKTYSTIPPCQLIPAQGRIYYVMMLFCYYTILSTNQVRMCFFCCFGDR